jgi:hypothetical protein
MRFPVKTFLAASGIVVTMVFRRKRQRSKHMPVTVPPPKEDKDADTRKETQKADQHHRVTIWRQSYLYVFAALLALSACAAWAFHINHSFVAGAFVLAAMACVAFLLRGPEPRTPKPIMVLAGLFAYASLFVVLYTTGVGIFSTTDPASLLQIIIFAVGGLAIVLAGSASWLRGWRFAEPLALGLIAILLGLTCLPLVRTFTTLVQFPVVNGEALLFATGRAGQRLELDVTTDPLFHSPTREEFDIWNFGDHGIRWVLVLVNDARLKKASNLTGGSTTPHTLLVKSPPNKFYAPQQLPTIAHVQLFSGYLSPSFGSAVVAGPSFRSFISSTSDKSAVVLPTYEQGDMSRVPQTLVNAIYGYLRGLPTIRSNEFTVTVNGGALSPIQSLTQAAPPKHRANSATLFWLSHSGVRIEYEVTDQDAVDATNGVLIVFAILLGVAGSSLVGSLQSLYHIISTRDAALGPGASAKANEKK